MNLTDLTFDAEHLTDGVLTNSSCVTLHDALAATDAPPDDLTISVATEAIARLIAESDGGNFLHYTPTAQAFLMGRATKYVEAIKPMLQHDGWRKV